MKLRVLITSVLFVCSLLSGVTSAQNKVVIIPLISESALDPEWRRAICRGYEVIGKKPEAKYNCSPKIVFVTSKEYNGNIGGVSGADAECQALADQSSLTLGRKFKAWISEVGSSPAETFIRSQTPYILVSGTKVADNWEDLIDGNLSNVIGLDEKGIVILNNNVWTGTNLSGQGWGADYTCNNWLSNDENDLALVGDAWS